jgi:hypothetical protein
MNTSDKNIERAIKIEINCQPTIISEENKKLICCYSILLKDSK